MKDFFALKQENIFQFIYQQFCLQIGIKRKLILLLVLLIQIKSFYHKRTKKVLKRLKNTYN